MNEREMILRYSDDPAEIAAAMADRDLREPDPMFRNDEPWECPACSGEGQYEGVPCRFCSETGLTGRDAQYIADMLDAYGGLP